MPAFSHSAYADEPDEARASNAIVAQEDPSTTDPADKSDQATADAAHSASQPQSVALGFVYFAESDLIAGAEQKIAVAADDDELTLISAKMTYTDPEGTEHQVSSEKCAGAAALFSLWTDGAGAYRLIEVTAEATDVTGAKKAISIDLSKEGDHCSFEATADTGAPLSAQSEGSTEATDGDMTVYALNAQGEMEETDGLDAAVALSGAAASGKASRAGKFVVALDPGHGGSDPGAVANGLNEADINWKIAQACKAELETYSNVEVYVTRGQKETLSSLSGRVDRAVAHGAKVFVSLHINSATATSAKGAEVWYPNKSSYNANAHTTGKELSQKILDELVALGLSDRDIKMKDSANGSKYPDGSTRDYYGVIASAREKGIPGIIVEHAFITNSEDSKKLGNDSFLAQLGAADARGIAKTFGLVKASGSWEQQQDGTWKYKQLDGSYAQNTWLTISDKRYWVDANGIMATGIKNISGTVYNFNSSGALQARSGWLQVGNDWYYFANSSSARTGWLKTGGKWYYLDPSTAIMKTGWVTVDGKKYFLNSSGAMRAGSGWFKDGGNWHWLTSSGAAKTGWQKVKSKWYYLDPATTVMATGWVDVAGKKYFLNSSGAMRTGGWFQQGGTWYWITSSGAVKTGWQKVKSKWYYLDSATAIMKTGWIDVDGKKYFLNSSGAMRTGGWFQQGSDWYWITGSGAAKTGWQKVSGKWYYLDPATAKMRTGWINVAGTWYYLNSSGAMKTGWFKDKGKWYYLTSSGAMATGWYTVGNKRYYSDSSGAMFVGEHMIDGKPCFFDQSGAFIGNGTPIMGVAKANAASMTTAFTRQLASMGKQYPAEVLATGGAPDPATFCRIIYEEAIAEGVRPEVVWAQVMWETGWLQMGNDVKLSQFNFAGLGATGNGVAGASFPDVRTGIRAQVQHLKCYASTDALVNDRVDPRWSNSLRGKAKLVEWLGMKENPNGTGWAASQSYGYSLRGLMKDKLGV